jgi:hypothetical protein
MSTLRDDEIQTQGTASLGSDPRGQTDADGDDQDQSDADSSDQADTTDDADAVDPDTGPEDAAS